MFDATLMEVGREYTLAEIPGFSPDDVPPMAELVADPRMSSRRAFIRDLCDAVRLGTVVGTYRHKPTDTRYEDLDAVPDTYGSPPEHTGIDDIEVLFARQAPR